MKPLLKQCFGAGWGEGNTLFLSCKEDTGESSYRRYLESRTKSSNPDKVTLDSGDEAFGEILAMHRSGLIFFINRFIRNIDIAEELTDDTFLELIIHPKRYNFDSPLKTYLYAIGRYKAISFIRKRKKLLPLSIDEAPEIEADEKTLEEQFVRSERDEMINRSIKLLPPEQQAFIHLMYFEGQDYDEIAKILGKSKKQLYNISQMAKTRLKEMLHKEGISL